MHARRVVIGMGALFGIMACSAQASDPSPPAAPSSAEPPWIEAEAGVPGARIDAGARRDTGATGDAALGDAQGIDGFACDGRTCFDPRTGLLWENPSGDATPTWDDAVRYCASLSIEGGGWRLPNIQELRSIIRGCATTELGGTCKVHDPDCATRACMEGCDQCVYPVVNGQRHCTWPAAFGGSCEHLHWSSTSYEASITPGVWYVDFGNGGWVHGAPTSIGSLVRCVRGTSSL